MAEARLPDFKAEIGKLQGPLHGKVGRARRPKRISALLTLRDIERQYGLYDQQVYALEEAGLIDALQRDGKGRLYYSEAQLRRALTISYHLSAAA